MIPYPMIITREASSCPTGVTGWMSPYPTVVSVTMAQYTPLGMLVKPASEPSIRNMSEPTTTTMVRTVKRNTVILYRLALRAAPRTLASPTYWASFKTRKTLKNPEDPNHDEVLAARKEKAQVGGKDGEEINDAEEAQGVLGRLPNGQEPEDVLDAEENGENPLRRSERGSHWRRRWIPPSPA